MPEDRPDGMEKCVSVCSESPQSQELHPHVHSHTHSHTHAHSHAHTHTHTKDVLNRLSKAEGHLAHVKKLVEKGEECTGVLIQLSAVIGALNKTAKIIMEDHLDHCIVEAVKEGDTQAVEDLKKAIEQMMK